MESIKEQKEILARLKFTGAQPLGGEFQSEYNDCCESAVELWPELLNWAERIRGQILVQYYREAQEDGRHSLAELCKELLEDLPE